MNADRQALSLKRKGVPWRTIVLALVGIGGIAGLSFYASHRNKYPYGWSHSCAKELASQLWFYAEENNGCFPSGRTTPEASLGLLYDGTDDFMIGLLRGKTVPENVTRAALKTGKFGPESTGWHYVEGLRSDDDPQIAVAWDKIHGLGHNGQRLEWLARSVIFLDSSEQGISEEKWPDFVADQKARLAKLIASRVTNSPAIRWSDEESLGPNTPQK